MHPWIRQKLTNLQLFLCHYSGDFPIHRHFFKIFPYFRGGYLWDLLVEIHVLLVELRKFAVVLTGGFQVRN